MINLPTNNNRNNPESLRRSPEVKGDIPIQEMERRVAVLVSAVDIQAAGCRGIVGPLERRRLARIEEQTYQSATVADPAPTQSPAQEITNPVNAPAITPEVYNQQQMVADAQARIERANIVAHNYKLEG